MKKILLLIFALLACGIASATITKVATSATGSATNTTGATLLVVGCYGASAATSASPSESFSSTGTAFNTVNIYYAYGSSIGGSSQTFACTGGYIVGVIAYAGTQTTSSVFDKRGTCSGDGEGCTASASPAVANEAAFSLEVDTNNDCDNAGVPSGWTSISNNSGNCSASAYFISTNSSTISAAWPSMGEDASSQTAIIALFEPASGPTATAPTCSSNCAGSYTGAVTATFANSNSGTTIMCYTVNGSTPATNGLGTACSTGTSMGTGATGTVSVTATETVKVVAGVNGDTDSSVLSEAYTITASAPTCSANCAGTYASPTTVTFANSNADTTLMCYTTNGTTPVTNGSGTGCTTGTSLGGAATENYTVSNSETVKVVAGMAGATDSSVLSEAYTITLSITTSSLPNGLVGSAYSQTLTAAGGVSPYTWSINGGGTLASQGAACAGLSLSSGGAITGTPTTAGTCTATYKVTDNVSSTATATLSIFVSAGTLANPVPVYNVGGTTSFTMPTGSTGCYTVDGSTPTATTPGTCSHGTSCSASACTHISPSGTNVIEILATEVNWTNSSVVTVQPDIAVASDNFQSYINPNWLLVPGNPTVNYQVAYSGVPVQLPIDLDWTNAAWQKVSGSNGEIYPLQDTVVGGGAVDLVAYGSGTLAYNLTEAERVSEGYYANHGSITYIHYNGSIGEGGGPSVRCGTTSAGTGPCISLVFYGNASPNVYLQKGNGTAGGLENTTLSYSDGSFAELRAIGCVYTPLLNGSPITGLPAYTDTGCTQAGQPGVNIGGSATNSSFQNPIYNWSGYNIGGTASGYTPPSIPSPATYTDAMDTSTMDLEPPLSSPWFHFSFWGGSSWIWSSTFVPIAYNSTYGAGDATTANTQYEYQDIFGVNQWEAWTVSTHIFNSGLLNYFGEILNQPFIYGYANGGCTVAGTGASCYDTLGYYLGEEPVNNTSRSAGCAGKEEYCGTPFFHITKVTPQTSPGNQVVLVAPSVYALMQGDLIEVRYLNGYLEAWCKQGSSPVAFQNNHTYTAGSNVAGTGWIVDSNGNIQQVTTSGTSQTSGTPTWGTTWSSYTGATTTSGSAVFTFWGTACPTTTKYTRMIHVADGDLRTASYSLSENYLYGTGSEPFTAGETITQSTSGAHATVLSCYYNGGASSVTTMTGPVTGTPNGTNIWTGGTSGYTVTPSGVPVAAPTLGVGLPGIFGGLNIPIFTLWSAGTVGTSGEPCGTAGQCQEGGYVINSGPIM